MATKDTKGGKTDEIELKEDLDRVFKPLFEEYEETGGIPLRVLRERLVESGSGEHFPQAKIESLLRRADADADGHLDYNEFVELMTSEEGKSGSRGQHLTMFQQMVRGAVSTVVPNHTTNKYGEEVVEDYIDHYNCKPPPLFMPLISLAEVIVFIVYAVELANAGTPVTATTGVPLYSPFIYNPSRRYEVWRYLTYMLIHQGYMHLIFNLIFQLFLGLPLEVVHKWWRMMIVYFLGVIAGSLCHSIFDTHTLLAGASGGCYALIGAHFAIVIMNWKEMTHDWMAGPVKFLCSGPVRLLVWTLFAAIDTGMAIWNRYHGDGGENIGYAAHFGGAMAGLLIGIPVLKNISVKPWERILWWISLSLYTVFVIFAVCWNAFYPDFPPTDWRPCCPMPKY